MTRLWQVISQHVSSWNIHHERTQERSDRRKHQQFYRLGRSLGRHSSYFRTCTLTWHCSSIGVGAHYVPVCAAYAQLSRFQVRHQSRVLAHQALHFSACNIEKWEWPGVEAKYTLRLSRLLYSLLRKKAGCPYKRMVRRQAIVMYSSTLILVPACQNLPVSACLCGI